MTYWGAGSTLGLLTCLGYFVFSIGAIYLWRNRAEVSFWMDNEVSSLRRNFSRYESAGPFYIPRTQSRLRVIPQGVYQSVTQLPKRHFSLGAFLLLVGFSLFFLDFFI
jgi:hypothetical protein